MYYLASNRPLPLVQGDEHFPAFAVSAIGEDEELRIRTVIASPFIYYLASWQGCSCGFRNEEDPAVERELTEGPDGANRAMCLDSLQAATTRCILSHVTSASTSRTGRFCSVLCGPGAKERLSSITGR